MKKQSKLFVSLMMALAMLVSTFAGTVSQGTVAKAATTHPTALVPAKVTDWTALPTSAKSTFELKGKNSDAAATDETTAVILPVQMDYAGVLELGVTASATTGSISAALYKDANCSQAMGSAMKVDSSNKYLNAADWSISAAATYYLKVKWDGTVPAQGTNITVGAWGYSGEEITLSSDLQLIWSGDNTVTKYHKINVKSDSQFVLEGYLINPDATSASNSIGTLSFKLCDKNKKQLRDISFNSSNRYGDYVALKKGTYYVAVNTAYPYTLRCASSKVKDQSGASQKKAATIKKGKTVKGMVGLSEGTKKADWYKVSLPKRTKLKLKYSALCTGSSSLKLQVIPANKRTRLTGDTTIYLKSGSGTLSSRDTLAKGTYYIKISKTNKTDNGSYSIKYVK